MKVILCKYNDTFHKIIPTEEGLAVKTIEQIAEISWGECYIVEDSILPPEKYFRPAWIFKDGKIFFDMSKAKEIHKNKMRKIRKPVLEALDIEYIKANEANDEAKKLEIVAKKQKLRDITNLELPNDIEALKNFIPDILK